MDPMLAEFCGTCLMILFGVGVHCDEVLKHSKYQGSGHMFAITTWSFGISVVLFVFGGLCLNPAMVLAQCLLGLKPWAVFVPYSIAELAGAFVGACIVWFIYADQFRESHEHIDPVAVRNIFSTNPPIRNLARCYFVEAFDTFVFLSSILALAHRVDDNPYLLAIGVGLIVWAVGMGLGGVTGFAMNQARDLGPRLAYTVLPIKNKTTNDWLYGLLVPGTAPFVGACCAAAFLHFGLHIF